jgi:hypothetical protein
MSGKDFVTNLEEGAKALAPVRKSAAMRAEIDFILKILRD